MRKSIVGAACTCLAVFSFSADAALVGRLAATPGGDDYQAYYDDVADLTWLQDATSGFPGYGGSTQFNSINQIDANTWVAGLNVAGVTGWRLPATIQPDATCSIQNGAVSEGFNCTGGELGNLFYNVLGGSASSSLHNANYDLFSNTGKAYWTSTLLNPGVAWYFYTGNGYQGNWGISDREGFYVWAVHSGDVSAVPIPSAVWLFGSGLLGLIGFSRRKA